MATQARTALKDEMDNDKEGASTLPFDFLGMWAESAVVPPRAEVSRRQPIRLIECSPKVGKPKKRFSSPLKPTNDDELRRAVRERVARLNGSDPTTIVVEELGLRHGSVRIDIAVINGSLHGYELKSDRDSLRRLPRQVRFFGSVCDFITLVGNRHNIAK